MDDVVDIERDFRRAKQGETLIYTTLHGLKTGDFNIYTYLLNFYRVNCISFLIKKKIFHSRL